MNGRQLAEEARRLRPDLKVLLTSGYAADALVHGSRLDAGIQLLSKPFSYGALRTKVRGALNSTSRPPRILIVENDPMVRLTLVETLADAGCEIEQAATASEALTAFRALRAELDGAIIDVGLPDGRGDRLVEAFHALRPELDVVLASGYGDGSATQRFAGSSNVQIPEKPLEGARVLRVLRQLLARSTHDPSGDARPVA